MAKQLSENIKYGSYCQNDNFKDLTIENKKGC